MELARKLIIAAKDAGADCVKFQSWSKETIFSRIKYEENCFLDDDYKKRTDWTLEEIVDAYAISREELREMKRFADTIGVDCIATPFSRVEVDFLVDELDMPFIKVASMDLNNYPFLEYIAGKGKPVVLATGLSDLYEIDRAIRTIERTGNKQLIILHCVSIYPPEDAQVNLRNILTLQQLYPDYPIGFSDHTLGTTLAFASVALGACLIEKHFTLDKNLPGWDHQVSATPDEMSCICTETKRIVQAMGTSRIACVEDERRRKEFRRSIVLARDMKKGEFISEEDIDYKRPGTGLAPEKKGPSGNSVGE